MDKRLLHATTTASGLLDANGEPIPGPKIDIRSLPEIDRADFPVVPADMEMRLLTPANGAEPMIVLFCPRAELHLEVPVTEMHNLFPHVAKLRFAVERLAMGLIYERDPFSHKSGMALECGLRSHYVR